MGLVDRVRAAAAVLTRPAAPTERSFVSFDFSKPPSDYPVNWWQLGLPVAGNGAMAVSAAYACVSIIAQEIARMEIGIWRFDDTRRQRRPVHPNFTRLLRRPNWYQTRSDFWLAVVYSLLTEGNAYVWAERRSGQVVAWHPLPPRTTTPMVVENLGEVFYNVTPWQMAPQEWDPGSLVPAGDIMHLRLFCPGHPLIGETPLRACAPALAQATAIGANSAAFFTNMSRPSGIITAPPSIRMTQEEANRIKDRFTDASAEAASGKPIVLGNGFEWTPLTISAADAQLIEQYKMSLADVARVFRVPPTMVGFMDQATYSNAETLQRAFVVQCLGFYLDHIECALSAFIGLTAGEYVEFDVEGAMMRPEFGARMDAFAKAVQGGVYAPNEVREMEHLPSVDGGDTVFLQKQMVPVDVLREQAEQQQAPPAAPQEIDEDDAEAEEAENPGPDFTSAALSVMRRSARRNRRRAS